VDDAGLASMCRSPRPDTLRGMIATVLVRAAVPAAIAIAYGGLIRPRLLRLGASAGERAAAYPGDDLIPGGRRGSIMATTLPAPPTEVWPWLAQMGADKAGFYSFDRLDTAAAPAPTASIPNGRGSRRATGSSPSPTAAAGSTSRSCAHNATSCCAPR